MPFALAHRLLVGRGHFDHRLSRFTGGRKAWIDEIDVVSAQSHRGITQSKMARAPLFSGLIGLHEKRTSILPYPHLQSSFFSLILAHALFYCIQLLSYGSFTHPNALFHASAYIQLAFFTRISNHYQD